MDDQTPLPFVMDDNKTYESKGAEEVWCVTGASGLDKRQCTAQLTIFADGSVLPPLLIFRGQGKRIKTEERRRWDQRVKVTFQPNAWCDENIMLEWVNEQWGNVLLNPNTPGSTGKIMCADVHTTQQTDSVQRALNKKATTLVNVPSGTTSRIQPSDVSVNKPFKGYIREQFESHMQANMDLYVQGKLSASPNGLATLELKSKHHLKIPLSAPLRNVEYRTTMMDLKIISSTSVDWKIAKCQLQKVNSI